MSEAARNLSNLKSNPAVVSGPARLMELIGWFQAVIVVTVAATTSFIPDLCQISSTPHFKFPLLLDAASAGGAARLLCFHKGNHGDTSRFGSEMSP